MLPLHEAKVIELFILPDAYNFSKMFLLMRTNMELKWFPLRGVMRTLYRDLNLIRLTTMHAFVTVGSTHFHSFIASIFTEKVLSVLRQKGYTDLVVQCGNSAFELADSIKNGETQTLRRSGVNIQFWKFKPDLEEDIKRADLVIAHAGTYAVLFPEL